MAAQSVDAAQALTRWRRGRNRQQLAASGIVNFPRLDAASRAVPLAQRDPLFSSEVEEQPEKQPVGQVFSESSCNTFSKAFSETSSRDSVRHSVRHSVKKGTQVEGMSEDDPEGSKQQSRSAEGAAGEPSFEQALARLELIVDRLEEGDVELESALADFEEGVKLTRRCAGELANAERRIEILVREGEKWIARPFLSADGVLSADNDKAAEAGEED